MSEFGQKVNNYSAYSVIMVPVSTAPEEEEEEEGWQRRGGGVGVCVGGGSPGRLSSSVMKYGQPSSVLHLDIY